MWVHGYGKMSGLTKKILRFKKPKLLAILSLNPDMWFSADTLAQQLQIKEAQVRVLIAYCCVMDDDAFIASSAGHKNSGFKWATHPDELDHSVNDLHSRILKMTLRASAQERKRIKLLTQIEETQTLAQL